MKRKIPKWLKYAHSLYPNDEFFVQFQDQVPLLFEDLIGRKIDWQRAWLFIEPISEKYIFHYSLDAPLIHHQNRELVLMKCSLGSVHGNIGWYNNSGLETINIQDEIGDRKLKFVLNEFDLRAKYFHSIPNIEQKSEKKILMKIGEIAVSYDILPHEGYVAIHFKENPQPEIVNEIGELLEEGRGEWNHSGDKGLFHNIYFTEMEEEKVALFYFDNGSAHDGLFAFILNKLADKELGIERIEIVAEL